MPCAARANLLICWKPTLPGSALPQMKAAARAALAAPITRASAALSMKNITKSWCAKGWFTPAFAAAVSCTPPMPRSDGKVVYAGTCRNLTPEEIVLRTARRKPAWRVMVPDETISFVDGHMGPYAENLAQDCGDFYLRRADGVFAYQLAVVVDDALMGVTQVVRGADLLSSTPRQLWLYRELGLPAPEFYHMPLLLAVDGRRLSKRDGDESLEHLQARYTPEQIIGRLAYACGLQNAPDPRTPAELADGFSWQRVPQNDIILPEGLF